MDYLRNNQIVNFSCPAIFIIVAFHALSSIQLVYAQEAGEGANSNVEEIVVTGKRSLLSLKFEAYRAEDRKYTLFNSLNSSDEFDITCGASASSSSRIKNRTFEVGFMKKARAIDVEHFFGSGIMPRGDGSLATMVTFKTKALNKEMIALALENPALADAMIEAYDLQQLYINARREKFKDSILIGHPESEN